MPRVQHDYSTIKVGGEFGLWTVTGPMSGGRVPVRCRCGESRNVRALHLLKGLSTGCGCTRLAALHRSRKTHGESKTTLYRVWKGMRERCSNPKHTAYQNYGARGIVVCEEWRDYSTFAAWAMANGYQKGLEIDRRDNDGNYEPSNCWFVTTAVNANNTRRNHFVSAFGKTKTVAEWVRDHQCVVPYTAMKQRIDKGWDAEAAITTPLVSGPKLTEEMVAIIRARLASGESKARIARDCNIDPSIVSRINSGKAWKHA